MPDKKSDKVEYLTFTDPDNCPVEFVGMVAASGLHNNIVNITFATPRFTPNNTGGVDADFIIAKRLRMDLQCAVQLHAELARIIGQAETAVRQALATTAVAGPSGKAS